MNAVPGKDVRFEFGKKIKGRERKNLQGERGRDEQLNRRSSLLPSIYHFTGTTSLNIIRFILCEMLKKGGEFFYGGRRGEGKLKGRRHFGCGV